MLRLTLFVCLVLGIQFVSIAQPDPVELVRRAENNIKGETSKGEFTMIISTPRYTREMTMESYWEGDENALIVVKSPRREQGNKTLKVDNEMWMYLRNTETTIKVPPSMMLQSWMGSDFTNDDLVRESDPAEDYHISLIGEEMVNAQTCWKLELIPKETAAVVWGKLIYWVRKNDQNPARTDFFDEDGKRVRHLVYEDYKTMDGRVIPAKWVMYNDQKKDRYTAFVIKEIDFDVEIPARLFSIQQLQRGF